MNFAVLRRPRTQALLDGSVELAAPAARWHAATDPLGWSLQPAEKHRDLAMAELDGGEMSVSSFVQAKSRGAPLVALPIFLKRGLVQRSLFCPADSPLSSPDQLGGKRVGLVSSGSSMAVWIRGVLKDCYGVDSSSVLWFTLCGASHTSQSLTIPDEFLGERIQAWEELDGYPHELDQRETFLLSLLDRGALDAVISFQARIARERSKPLLHEANLWSHHPLNSEIYPINHLFVLKTDTVRDFPSLPDLLLYAFRQSRELWTGYLPQRERQVFEKEMAKLGYDPFAYRLAEVEKRTMETFVSYLESERLIPCKVGLDELFYGGF